MYRHRFYRWLLISVLIALVGCWQTDRAFAQITRARCGGFINYDSGFAGGAFTTGIVNPIPLTGISLVRTHNTPEGASSAATTARVFVSPNRATFSIFVTPSTQLHQLRTACFPGARAAKLKLHIDCNFDVGPLGLPGQFLTVSFPFFGRNAPGPGSFTRFKGTLHLGTRVGEGVPFQSLGTIGINFADPFPGHLYNTSRTAIGWLPRLPGNILGRHLLVWADVEFEVKGCPGVGPAAIAAAGEDGTVGTPDDYSTPDFDPDIPYDAIAPADIMDMDPELGDDAPDDTVDETTSTDESTELNVDFEHLPLDYYYFGGRQNLGDAFGDPAFGPGCTILDRNIFGYNDADYPPHSGDAVMASIDAPNMDMQWAQPVTGVSFWYTSGTGGAANAYLAGALVGTKDMPPNLGTNSKVDFGGLMLDKISVVNEPDYITIDDVSFIYPDMLDPVASLFGGPGARQGISPWPAFAAGTGGAIGPRAAPYPAHKGMVPTVLGNRR